MRYTLMLSIMTLMLLPTALHATEWSLQDVGSLQSIRAFTSTEETYVAAGNSGYRMYSEDSGETWVTTEKTSSTWWYDLEVGNEKMHLIGQSGGYMQSEDNGLTWHQVSVGTTSTLNDIEMTEGYGYMVGESGVAYYFANNQWHSATSNTTKHLNAVQDMADGTAWVVADEGWLFRVTGAGLSWISIGQVASTHLNDVHFVSSTEGWVVGNNGVIRFTEDAGSSWVTVSIDGLTNQDLHALEVVDEEMVIVGEEIIAYSNDNGENWEVETFTDRSEFYVTHVDAEEQIWVAGSRDDAVSLIYQLERTEEVVIEDSLEEIGGTSEEENEVEAETSTLIKMTCEEDVTADHPCKAVYYYGDDGKRHAFPNERVFFTWYEDFDSVQEVSAAFMASIQLGANVTYRPGVKMVKFQSVNTVYAISAPAELRPIASEAVAEELYGSEWNTQIDDIPDVFIGNYSFGEEINLAQDYDSDMQESGVSEISDIF